MKRFEYLNIEEIKTLLIKKEIKAIELVEYFINRIKKYGLVDSTNSICSINQNCYKEAKRIDKLIDLQ